MDLLGPGRALADLTNVTGRRYRGQAALEKGLASHA